MDVKTEKEDYSYVFQICGDVVDVPGAGIVQVERKKTGTQSTMIGTYNYTQIIGGSKLSDYHKLIELCPRGGILLLWMMTSVLTVFPLPLSFQVSG